MADSMVNPKTPYLGISRRSWREPVAIRQAYAAEGILARGNCRATETGAARGQRRASVSRLATPARRWIAHRHIRAAISRANRQGAAGEGKRNAESGERRSRELSQRSKALEFWGLVHDGSDRFMVESGNRCARLGHG